MLLIVILLIITLNISCNDGKPDYCIPSENCWPTMSDITQFKSKLNGDLVIPTDSDYDVYIDMTQNLLVRNQYPALIVVCDNVEDIQESVLFASTHNIQISILSTGHSWSGVSTANYSLQINLSKIRQYFVNDSDPNNMAITVSTGMNWGEIYHIVDQYDKMIVGGADPSVGPAGLSLGGGHGPLSTTFGLSSDFITEFFMVDANAQIVHIYNTFGINKRIDDLFWSLRGGGGGTFGVIINITFSLQNPVDNSVLNVLQCVYSFWEMPTLRKHHILDIIINNIFELVHSQQLDDKWGGYLMVPVSVTDQEVLQINWILYGDSEYAQKNVEPMLHLNEPYNNSQNFYCSFSAFDTYLQFAANIPPFTNGIVDVQVFNTLVPTQNLTQELTETIVGFFNSSTIYDGWIRSMTTILLSGAISEKSDDFTSVHPAFRNSWMELGFSMYWTPNDVIRDRAIQHSNEWESQFWKFGYSSSGAIYSNEENYECDSCDWKQMFWGNKHYKKLLKVKRKWDPNQVFWCNHCIGDEMNDDSDDSSDSEESSDSQDFSVNGGHGGNDNDDFIPLSSTNSIEISLTSIWLITGCIICLLLCLNILRLCYKQCASSTKSVKYEKVVQFGCSDDDQQNKI